MMIRESTSPFRELELAGSASELRAIGKAILGLHDGETCRFTADHAADPSPYERTLNAFEIAATGGLVRLIVNEKELIVTGDSDLLAKFASFFDFDDISPPGFHFHYEWHEGNPCTAPDSRFLVVSVL